MDTSLLDDFWFKGLAGMMVGLTLGSFVTMLSYRLPRGLSIVRPPSSCPRCQTRLGARDLVPVFSWLCVKGRCRHCHWPISPRYPLIELVVALLVTGVFVLIGFQLSLIPALLAIVALTTGVTLWVER